MQSTVIVITLFVLFLLDLPANFNMLGKAFAQLQTSPFPPNFSTNNFGFIEDTTQSYSEIDSSYYYKDDTSAKEKPRIFHSLTGFVNIYFSPNNGVGYIDDCFLEAVDDDNSVISLSVPDVIVISKSLSIPLERSNINNDGAYSNQDNAFANSHSSPYSRHMTTTHLASLDIRQNNGLFDKNTIISHMGNLQQGEYIVVYANCKIADFSIDSSIQLHAQQGIGQGQQQLLMQQQQFQQLHGPSAEGILGLLPTTLQQPLPLFTPPPLSNMHSSTPQQVIPALPQQTLPPITPYQPSIDEILCSNPVNNFVNGLMNTPTDCGSTNQIPFLLPLPPSPSSTTTPFLTSLPANLLPIQSLSQQHGNINSDSALYPFIQEIADFNSALPIN